MTAPAIDVRHFASAPELQTALVQRLETALVTPVSPPTAVMLSGGSTPLPAYRELARRAPRPAPGLRVLFSDDRYVPADAAASNFHQTLGLLDALALPEDAVVRVRTELPLQRAAQDYEQRIDALLRAGVQIGLGLLGLGADGHTASLFTLDDLARAQGRRAIPVDRPDGMQAVSVTPAVLEQVADLIFVVAGHDKRQAVESLLARDADLPAYAAVRGRARIGLWLAGT
jgi:6-phosphogluconolactonase/glucosamine-6-phosphate isomerase/deaminase